MLCPRFLMISLPLALGATAAAAGEAKDQRSWKLYDVRDLIGLLPAAPPFAWEERLNRPVATFMMPSPADAAARPKPKDRGSTVDKLMRRLCGALMMEFTRLLPGVYAIGAKEADHAQLLNMLESVRALYAERYEVELVWFAVAADQTPAVGDRVTPVAPLHRHHLVVSRRTPTRITAVTRYSYLADVTAVVATSAVAYDPETGRTGDGMRLSILVGAGEEDKNTTRIRLTGEMHRVTMGRMSRAGFTPEAPSMYIELPTTSVRSIQSDLRIRLGELTVLNVLDGFEGGKCMVIAAAVQKL